MLRSPIGLALASAIASAGVIGGTVPTHAAVTILAPTLNQPTAVAADTHGDLFFTDAENRVVEVKPGPDGTIGGSADTDDTSTTVAGTPGMSGYSGDGGSATSATLYGGAGIALDTAANLYIADNTHVRFVCRQAASCVLPAGAGGTVAPGNITTVAGNGSSVDVFGQFETGDGGAATSAIVANAVHLALDGNGNLYIGEPFTGTVRFVCMQASTCIAALNAPAGMVPSVLGSGDIGKVAGLETSAPNGTGVPCLSTPTLATTAALYCAFAGVAVDAALNVYVGDVFGLRMVCGQPTPCTLPASSGGALAPGMTATIAATGSAVSDPALPTIPTEVSGGKLYIANGSRCDVLRMPVPPSVQESSLGLSDVAGSGNCTDLGSVTSVTIDSSGALYIADPSADRIVKDVAGTIVTVVS